MKPDSRGMLHPVNADVQAAQIASAYLDDVEDVAAAKAAFTAAFDDAATGGLAAKQAPAPVHVIAAPAPLVAAPLDAPVAPIALGYNGLGYAGLGHLGYAGLGHLRYAGHLGYNGLTHTGLGHLGYAGLGFAGLGYNPVGHLGYPYGVPVVAAAAPDAELVLLLPSLPRFIQSFLLRFNIFP